MTLSRRSMLVGLGGLAAGGGALVSTGAFTTVEAERTVDVQTAGDANALLSLEKIDGSPNSDEYATKVDDMLEVNIPDVNLNAITKIDRVFQVTNNGTQAVVLYFEEDPGNDHPDGNAIDVGTRSKQLENTDPTNNPSSDGIKDSNILDISNPKPPESGDYNNIGVYLDVGTTLEVGLYIDTSDKNLNDGLSDPGEGNGIEDNAPETLLENLIIWADAGAADNGDYQFEAA